MNNKKKKITISFKNACAKDKEEKKHFNKLIIKIFARFVIIRKSKKKINKRVNK